MIVMFDIFNLMQIIFVLLTTGLTQKSNKIFLR